MGVYYHPKNKEIEPMLPNFAGADIIGLIGKSIEFQADLPKGMGEDLWRIPYEATHRECLDVVIKLDKELAKESPFEYEWIAIVKYQLFDGTYKQFVEHIKWWRDWFEKCEGYEAD